MKTKTSITLSQEILRAIDAHMAGYKSRSDFLETAARVFIDHLEKKEAELRDLEIINKHADTLNEEAEDVLGYQVPI
ncbi:MAG: ribbon-helix-helix domain-containing protein [Desulfotignum sp.]|nr:ribbon-helix-helix domain-containing protein [Desulfotignum sp.]